MGCSHPGYSEIGANPVLKNSISKNRTPRWSTTDFCATVAIAMTTKTNPMPKTTGTRTAPIPASHPWVNRNPMSAATANSTTVPSNVRTISASTRPARKLDRGIGSVHSLPSTPDSRSDTR
ncbi:Uncharacterised protein [Mycobacteroides abscessus subsp. abscessus]|nr:Uncharacterised protein [Mycobacteroides abscessus subsp. abscessus]